MMLGAGALALCVAAATVLTREGGVMPGISRTDMSKRIEGNRPAPTLEKAITAASAALAASKKQPAPMEPIPPVDQRDFQVPSAEALMADARSAQLQATGANVANSDPSIGSRPRPAAAAAGAPVAVAASTQPAKMASAAPAKSPRPAPVSAPVLAASAKSAASPEPRESLRVSEPVRLLSGGLTNSDNPYGRYVGTLTVSFVVGADGRVSNCRPVVSSGKAELDAATCGLVENRMRFSPALDQQGQAVASEIMASYRWGRTRRH